MQILLAFDDGTFQQISEEELSQEYIDLHNTGELTIIALRDNQYHTAAVDRKGEQLEIVRWNPI